jgi:ubiquinone/menaquinone biosynthesis C-methylase UbiE
LDWKTLYRTQAVAYERLVAAEDYQGNILPALLAIRPFARADVVEFGAGTGRLTCMLAPLASRIRAYDESAHMLSVAERKLRATGLTNWETAVADNRQLPAGDDTADIAIEGWSFGHAVGHYPDSWRHEIGRALAEMERILRPGGTMILLETLGTGYAIPHRQPGLAEFYDWLETTHHFNHKWIRTDYQFSSPAEGADTTRFFFGDEMAERILAQNLTILPECTGIWWLTSIEN